MKSEELHFHYVCTHDEARRIAEGRERYWVSNCGCREPRGDCSKSRMDVCLFLKPDMGGTGSGFREVDRDFVDGIFAEARRERLVARPFRDDADRTLAQGVCFCCDCCCAYSLNPGEKCGKGTEIETTNLEECAACGNCVNACYFGARRVAEAGLSVDADACYGCGLCVDACPGQCIAMQPRGRNPVPGG